MTASDPTSRSTVSYREVAADAAGQRLDNFLLAALKGVPRSHVYRLIRSGQVRVNSGRATASYRIQAGDRIRLPPVRRGEGAPPQAQAGGLEWLEQRIVYEDERLLVLDKPAGLAVHGGSRVALGCIEALRSLRPQAQALELVHRLDRATSGCLLVAKRRSALRTLHAMLREGSIDKRYFALLMGSWPEGATRVAEPLVTTRREGEARVKVDRSGKLATSEFRLIERVGVAASFVDIAIRTGRTHQIRVHAAHTGHPVAGDDRYGDRRFNAHLEGFGLRRMFLHAHTVAFAWPESGEEFSVSVPLPDELKRVLDALSGDRGPRPRAARAPRRAKSRPPKSRVAR